MFKPITKLLFAAAVTAMCASNASALTLRLTIDNPDNVTVETYDGPVAVHAGENVFEDLAEWSRYEVIAKEGCILKKVNESGGSASSWTQSHTVYVQSDMTVSVESAKLADVQTGSFTVNVDNPGKVRVTLPTTSQYISPVQGANTIRYIPGVDQTVTLANAEFYNVPFYKVTRVAGGETSEIPFINNSYDMMISEDMTVDVLADYPADLYYPVSFTFTNPGTEQFLTDCTVGGQPVEGFRDGFEGHAGDKVVINRANNLYQVNSLTVNGETQNSYSSVIEFTLTAATEIVADVEKYPVYTLKVNVNDPQAVGVYRSYVSDATRIAVSAGENTIECPQNDNIICFKAVKGYQIDSCTISDGDMEWDDWQKYYKTTVTSDGLTIDVTASPIIYDKHFIAYFQGLDQLIYGTEPAFSNAGYEYYPISEGYNSIGYLESEAPFRFVAYGVDACYGYLNNTPLESSYGSFQFTPQDGDVFKFYINEEPGLYTVNFTVENEAGDASAVTGKYDMVKDLDFTQPLEALDGTAVEIYGNNLSVTVDGTDIPCTGDSYAFNVRGNHNVVITKKQVGIDGIYAGSGARDVYNLQGILVIRGATEAQVRALPAGMYIVGGRKIVKK